MADYLLHPEPGDASEAFVTTFARHEAELRGFVRSAGFDWQHVDEIMQSVSLVLWRKWSEFDPKSEFMKWARVVARFEILKYRRQLARDRHVFDADLVELLADEAGQEAERLRSEAYFRALEHCLGKLPEPRRKVLLAAYQPQEKIRDVAERIGQSATALYKSLRRSREQLLQCIEGRMQNREVKR